MDLQRKNKLLTLLVAFLIVVNLITIAFMWYGYIKKKPAITTPPPGGRIGDMILARELDLTPEQAQQIARLRDDHFEKTGDLMQRLSELREEMADEVFSDSPDTQRINNLAAEIGQLRTQMEKQFFVHLSQIRKVCTPQQRRRCDRFFKRMLQKSDPLNRPGWKMRHRGRWGKNGPVYNVE